MKHKKHKIKKGYHQMPDGRMMSDEEMENYHKTRGRKMPVIRGTKLSVAMGKKQY